MADELGQNADGQNRFGEKSGRKSGSEDKESEEGAMKRGHDLDAKGNGAQTALTLLAGRWPPAGPDTAGVGAARGGAWHGQDTRGPAEEER